MAKLKLTGFVSRISGKLGGVIFGTSSNGTYVKNNSFSQQKNTPAQSIQRNKIVQASQSWRLTSQAQKELWIAEAVNYPYENNVGEVAFYNGFQLFQFLNQNNFNNGFPVLLSPPVFTVVNNADWLISINPSNVLIVGTANGVSGTTCQVWVSPQMRQGVVPAASLYRKLQDVTVTGGSQSIGIETAYENLFGMLEVGNFIFAKFKTIVTNNGNSAGFSNPDSVEVTS